MFSIKFCLLVKSSECSGEWLMNMFPEILFYTNHIYKNLIEQTALKNIFIPSLNEVCLYVCVCVCGGGGGGHTLESPCLFIRLSAHFSFYPGYNFQSTKAINLNLQIQIEHFEERSSAQDT